MCGQATSQVARRKRTLLYKRNRATAVRSPLDGVTQRLYEPRKVFDTQGPSSPVPQSRQPPKSGISQHPRFNSRTGDRSKTYRVRARADGAPGEKCRAKTKLDEVNHDSGG